VRVAAAQTLLAVSHGDEQERSQRALRLLDLISPIPYMFAASTQPFFELAFEDPAKAGRWVYQHLDSLPVPAAGIAVRTAVAVALQQKDWAEMIYSAGNWEPERLVDHMVAAVRALPVGAEPDRGEVMGYLAGVEPCSEDRRRLADAALERAAELDDWRTFVVALDLAVGFDDSSRQSASRALIERAAGLREPRDVVDAVGFASYLDDARPDGPTVAETLAALERRAREQLTADGAVEAFVHGLADASRTHEWGREPSQRLALSIAGDDGALTAQIQRIWPDGSEAHDQD